jgi:hypothetical protein
MCQGFPQTANSDILCKRRRTGEGHKLHYDRSMAIQLRWVGEDDLDHVAKARLGCYAKSASALEDFKTRMRTDPRTKLGDFRWLRSMGPQWGPSRIFRSTCSVAAAVRNKRGRKKGDTQDYHGAIFYLGCPLFSVPSCGV